MSVDFHATNVPFNGYTFRCFECEAEGHVAERGDCCPKCGAGQYEVIFEANYEIPFANLANGNAVTLGRFLGLPIDPREPYGSLDGDALKGAVVMMEAMLDADDDTLLHFERQPEGSVGRNGARILTMGIDREYLQRRGREVYNIAKWAVDHGEALTWG